MGRPDAHLVLPDLDPVCSADCTLASIAGRAHTRSRPIPTPAAQRTSPRFPRSVSGTALQTGQPCASGFERGR